MNQCLRNVSYSLQKDTITAYIVFAHPEYADDLAPLDQPFHCGFASQQALAFNVISNSMPSPTILFYAFGSRNFHQEVAHHFLRYTSGKEYNYSL